MRSISVARSAPVETNSAYGGCRSARPMASASATPFSLSRSPSLSVCRRSSIYRMLPSCRRAVLAAVGRTGLVVEQQQPAGDPAPVEPTWARDRWSHRIHKAQDRRHHRGAGAVAKIARLAKVDRDHEPRLVPYLSLRPDSSLEFEPTLQSASANVGKSRVASDAAGLLKRSRLA